MLVLTCDIHLRTRIKILQPFWDRLNAEGDSGWYKPDQLESIGVGNCYCGRNIEITGSDGHCGPTAGQCPACKQYQMEHGNVPKNAIKAISMVCHTDFTSEGFIVDENVVKKVLEENKLDNFDMLVEAAKLHALEIASTGIFAKGSDDLEEGDWGGCPGKRLKFKAGKVFNVATLSGNFFSTKEYSALFAPMKAVKFESVNLTEEMLRAAASDMQIVVTGAGTSFINGTYSKNSNMANLIYGLQGSAYTKDDAMLAFWNGEGYDHAWYFTDRSSSYPSVYINRSNDSTTVPTEGWELDTSDEAGVVHPSAVEPIPTINSVAVKTSEPVEDEKLDGTGKEEAKQQEEDLHIEDVFQQYMELLGFKNDPANQRMATGDFIRLLACASSKGNSDIPTRHKYCPTAVSHPFPCIAQ